MHILFIPAWFETPSRPTAGKAVKDLAIALSRQGISINILFQSSESVPEFQLIDGLKVFHSRSHIRGKIYPILERVAIHKFKSVFEKYILSEGLPDLVHIHGYSTAIFANYIKKNYKVPYVYSEHSSNLNLSKLGFIKKQRLKSILFSTSKCIAVSNFLANKMNYINDIIAILPNTIDFEKFRPIDDRKNHLIMINLLTKNKQVDKGIKVFKLWKEKNSNRKLYIIGDGPERKNLDHKEPDIQFLGETKEDEWLDSLQSASCLLLMSKSETFGVVVLEALACGVPVVCLDNGGISDILQILPENNMLTVLPQSTPVLEIVVTLENAISNYSRPEAVKIRNILQSKFDYPKVAQEYLNIYNSILN